MSNGSTSSARVQENELTTPVAHLLILIDRVVEKWRSLPGELKTLVHEAGYASSSWEDANTGQPQRQLVIQTLHDLDESASATVARYRGAPEFRDVFATVQPVRSTLGDLAVCTLDRLNDFSGAAGTAVAWKRKHAELLEQLIGLAGLRHLQPTCVDGVNAGDNVQGQSAAEKVSDAQLDVLRMAIKDIPCPDGDAKPEAITKHVKMRVQTVRAGLRKLEELGEYSGFAHRKSDRYQSE